MTRTTITTNVDVARDGTQTGHLFLPHSPHEDAWGAIPIAVVRNGTGPTVLRTGGVHGDEYEGPMADLVMDLHSGGSSLMILPSAIVEPSADPVAERRNLDACLAFNAPWTVRMAVAGDPRTATAAAVRQGRVVIGSELGGGGIASPEGIDVARRGIRNVLVELGMLDPRHRLAPDRPRTRVLAPCPWIFVPAQPLRTPGASIDAVTPLGPPDPRRPAGSCPG